MNPSFLISFLSTLIILISVFFAFIFVKYDKHRFKTSLIGSVILLSSVFYRLEIFEMGLTQVLDRLLVGLFGFLLPIIIVFAIVIYFNSMYKNIKFDYRVISIVVLLLFTNQVLFLQLNEKTSTHLIEPIFEYGHDENRQGAAIGGYVYRGHEVPELYGSYFFADFISGLVYSMNLENDEVNTIEVVGTDEVAFNPSSFGVDEQDELYITDRSMGKIYKLSYSTSRDVVFEQQFQTLNFSNPIGFFNAGDSSNRIFIIEQEGIIREIQNNKSSVFLNISSKIKIEHYEQGLLGLAFHPNYETNSLFFVTYTTGCKWSSSCLSESGYGLRLSRFLDMDNPSETVATESIILEVDKSNGYHNGGHIEFGNDGPLFFGIGDDAQGDSLGNAQNLKTVKGAILRLDVDNRSSTGNYTIPTDNPFYGNKDGFREEIWAYGLRNPWRFSIDHDTGIMYAADVGQYDREEINIILPGGNYGWAFFEGTRCFYSSKKDYQIDESFYSDYYCNFGENINVSLLLYNMLIVGTSFTFFLAASFSIFKQKSVAIISSYLTVGVICLFYWYYQNYVTGILQIVDMTEQLYSLLGFFTGLLLALIFLLRSDYKSLLSII